MIDLEQQNNLWKDWRLHSIVLVIVIISEVIGAHKIPLGMTSILLLPVVYAVLLGLAVYFTPLIKL